MINRLRIKFIFINMIIVTAMLCIILFMVLHFTMNNMESQSIQMMHAITMNPTKPGSPNDMSSQTKLPFFTLQIGADNELIDSVGSFYDLSDYDFLQKLINIVLSVDKPIGTIDEYNLRYLLTDTPFGKEIVFADMTNEINTITSLIRSCCLIGFIGFIAFLIISILLAEWAVSPVRKAWNMQKQFVADASHELKTPLTVIITNAELLKSGVCSDNTKDNFISAILTMSHQMRGLAESLIDLAKVDRDSHKASFSETDISALAYEAALPFEAIFFEKGLTLNTSITDGIKVNANPAQIQQLIEIFLDNAQKYSYLNTNVILSVKRSGKKHCLLSVSNTGDSISKDDLKNIFKRFYRIDKARSMNHSYGLGLSIAEGIAHTCNAKIFAESSDNINTFYVQFPIV